MSALSNLQDRLHRQVHSADQTALTLTALIDELQDQRKIIDSCFKTNHFQNDSELPVLLALEDAALDLMKVRSSLNKAGMRITAFIDRL